VRILVAKHRIRPGGPLESADMTRKVRLRRDVDGAVQDQAACAPNNLDVFVFLYEEKLLRCPGWHEPAGRDEVCVAPV